MNTYNISQFLRKFNKEYKFLYEHKDNVAGYREAVDDFDWFLEHHSEFVTEFANYRGDAITSDREAAAFMFAMEAMA